MDILERYQQRIQETGNRELISELNLLKRENNENRNLLIHIIAILEEKK